MTSNSGEGTDEARFEKLHRLHPYYLAQYSPPVVMDINTSGLPEEYLLSHETVMGALRNRDTETIRGQIETLHRLTSKYSEAYVLLAYALSATEEYAQAFQLFSALAQQHREMAGLPYMAGLCAYRSQQFSKAVEAFEECLRRDPNATLAAAMLGYIYALNDQWEEAKPYLDQAVAGRVEFQVPLIQLSQFFACAVLGENLPDFLELPSFGEDVIKTADRLISLLPPITGGRLEHPDHDLPVVFVGCDESYLEKFGVPLLLSLQEVEANCAVHFHIMQATRDPEEIISPLRERLDAVEIYYSSESDICPGVRPNAYFASARFCRFYQFLKANEKPTIIMDADSLFIRPLTAIPNFIGTERGYGLTTSDDAPLWERLAAGFGYWSGGEEGLHFWAANAAIIAQNLLQGKAPWFLDQVALFFALGSITDPTEATLMPSNEVMSTDHNDDAVIWTVTTEKGQETRFSIYLEALIEKYGIHAGLDFNEVVQSKYGPIIINKFDMYIGPSIKSHGVWCPAEMEVMSRYLKKGDVVIDAGANFGIHTLALAQQVGREGRVHAFEPQRLVFQALNGSIALNSLSNVHCYHMALGETVGSIKVPELAMGISNNFGALSLAEEWAGNPEVETVEESYEVVGMIDLDSLNLPRCDLIKADVEGMEIAMLKGARTLLENCRPVLFLEKHEGEKGDALVKFVAEHDYDIYFVNVPGNPNIVCLPREKKLAPIPGLPLLNA